MAIGMNECDFVLRASVESNPYTQTDISVCKMRILFLSEDTS